MIKPDPTKYDITPEEAVEAIRAHYPNVPLRRVELHTQDRNALGVTKRVQRLDLPRERDRATT